MSTRGHSEQDVRNLFRMLHGMYGNKVLDAYRTGQVDERGQDKGVLNAQVMWREQLRDFDALTVAKALKACEQRHPTFPPTLPEFLSLCRANQPRQTAMPWAPKQIEESPELRQARINEAMELLAKARAERAGEVPEYAIGLPGLRALCAHAFGLAGGDEAVMLLALERGERRIKEEVWA